MEQYIKKYSDLTENEIKGILNLIKKGGEVNNKTLPFRFSKTKFFGFYKKDENVIAIAAIKNPQQSYILNTFKKSNSNISYEDFKFELGYVMVEEEYRKEKLVSKLCYALIETLKNHNIFATTKVQNCGMKTILSKNNFNEVGTQYLNKNEDAFLKLYIKTQ
jgi:predicted GNAT family N-acyltransferase